jgi:hypothetical protein
MMTTDELASMAQEVSNRNETPPRPGVTAAMALRAVLATLLNQL